MFFTEASTKFHRTNTRKFCVCGSIKESAFETFEVFLAIFHPLPIEVFYTEWARWIEKAVVCFLKHWKFSYIFFLSLTLAHLLFELYHTTVVYLLMSYAITDDDDDDDSIERFALSSINLFMHKCFSSSCCPSCCCQNLSERRHMNRTFWGFNKMTATIFILFVPYIMWNLFCLTSLDSQIISAKAIY